MRPSRKAEDWLKRHGLGAAVILAAVGAFVLGLLVPVPDELPALAQGSTALWRVEQSAFSFAGFYLVVMAIALALQNRGFIEFGPGGLRAGDLTRKQQRTLEEQAEMLEAVRRSAEMNATLMMVAVNQMRRELRELERRVDELEDSS